MRVNLVRSFAILLGLGVISSASADFGQDATGTYVAPSKWSRFNSGTSAPEPVTSQKQTQVRTVSSGGLNQPQVGEATSDNQQDGSTELLPAPQSAPKPAPPATQRPAPPQPLQDSQAASSVPQPHPSAFQQALEAPWSNCDPVPPCSSAPARRPLSPWFAGTNVLLWDMSDDSYRRFAARSGAPTNTILSTDHVAADSAVGYDVSFGRYLDCGRYGLSVTYLNFDPSSEFATARTAAPGDNYATMAHWQQISIDRDGAGPGVAESVYDIYDNAAAHSIRRDVSIQGIELNLASFGIMGASRLANPSPCGPVPGRGTLAGLRRAIGLGDCYGYTNAGGSLARSCDGSVQVVATHGLRWFQFEDEFEFASTDAYDGYVGPTDMFYDSNVTNDLYGYQFGGRLIYCLGPRLVANIGGKAGIYGNDVYVEQRIGTPTQLAYVTSDATQQIASSDREVVLAGLGEIDLGLGYRLGNAWTINGGYRMLYASGVATSIGSIASEYYALAPSARAAADDSLLLHGAYIGATLNW
ncbi:MAG: hypothetical protein ACO1RT_07345 [Planctomycetaceae bacterium]